MDQSINLINCGYIDKCERVFFNYYCSLLPWFIFFLISVISIALDQLVSFKKLELSPNVGDDWCACFFYLYYGFWLKKRKIPQNSLSISFLKSTDESKCLYQPLNNVVKSLQLVTPNHVSIRSSFYQW